MQSLHPRNFYAFKIKFRRSYTILNHAHVCEGLFEIIPGVQFTRNQSIWHV